MLSVADLTVWFGQEPDRVTAVHGATFDVAQGESFGLVGESGSGKSTILRALAGLAPTWSGTITVDGETLRGIRRSPAFHRRVQMVFQDPYASLHPRHTVDRVLIMYAGRVVETLAARDLHDARHPYTQGLLNSLPRLDAPRERLAVLERRPDWKDGPLDPALVDASMIDAFPGGVR